MKCALIMPAWVPEDIFPSATARLQANYWQPLGLTCLASVLLRDGHQVRILDGSFLTHEHILEELRKWRPDIAGIHSNTFLWRKAQRTAEHIKSEIPEAFICVGGPHPTALGERALEEGAPGIDAAVLGEGELTLRELTARLERREPLLGLPGLVFRQGDEIIRNPSRPPIGDLDSLPLPARRLLESPHRYLPPPSMYRRKPVATMMTSRGCLNRCIYCFQMGSDVREVRYHSVGRVLDEIQECLREGYREIRFLDDSFTWSRDRVMQITEGIRSRNLHFSWFASSCVHQVDKPLLEAMRAAGCWAILFGAESGIQKSLNTLKKGTTPEQIRKAVQWAKAAGLHVTTPFLIGIPGETYRDCLETIRFACRLDPDVANFHTITPFPGTELYDKAEQYGWISSNLQDYTFQGLAFVPHTMTRGEMERIRSLAFRAFYSRPKLMLRRVSSARSVEDARTLWLGLKGLIRLWMEKDLFGARRDGNG